MKENDEYRKKVIPHIFLYQIGYGRSSLGEIS